MTDNQHWHDRWRDNRIGFHESEVNQHLRNNLPAFGLAPGSGIFVPLCGKSLDMAWLLGQGYQVLGIELSEIAIEAFFEEQGLDFQVTDGDRFREYRSGNLTLLQGDFFDLAADDLQHCALVYDRAALIAMSDEDRPRYYSHMLSITAVTAQMLLITFTYDPAQMAGPPFSVSDAEVERYYGEALTPQRLCCEDILDEIPRWREAGLTSLTQSVYRLERKPS